LGLGLVTWAAGDREVDASAYWSGAMLGAAGGFSFTYLWLAPNAALEREHATEMNMDLGPRLVTAAGRSGFERMPAPPDMLTATLRVHF
jgi:hypothetical protein